MCSKGVNLRMLFFKSEGFPQQLLEATNCQSTSQMSGYVRTIRKAAISRSAQHTQLISSTLMFSTQSKSKSSRQSILLLPSRKQPIQSTTLSLHMETIQMTEKYVCSQIGISVIPSIRLHFQQAMLSF